MPLFSVPGVIKGWVGEQGGFAVLLEWSRGLYGSNAAMRELRWRQVAKQTVRTEC